MKRSPTVRSGMTILEMLLAMTIFSVILVASMGFFQYQGRAFNQGNELMTLQQNLRYGVSMLEQHLHTVGIGVADHQPALVYAGDSVVAFNADYTTTDPNELFAVYYDADASAAAVTALDESRKLQLPLTSFSYPDTSYYDDNGNSPAETIIFFFASDTTTARTDDYMLHRQVNDLDRELIARNLLHTDSLAFFEYYEIRVVSGDSTIQLFPQDSLPLAHTAKGHNTPADTGWAARIDAIRGVRVRYTTTNGETGSAEQRRNISRLIRMPNAGLTVQQICGAVPLLGEVGFTATRKDGSDEKVYVELTWNAATDETSGEQDVARYIIWRSTTGTSTWGDPYVSVPAGQASYLLKDEGVTEDAGYTYYYALAAQDCTPSQSELATASEYVP